MDGKDLFDRLTISHSSHYQKHLNQHDVIYITSRFAGKMGEAPKYTGRILAVGISYNRKTKEHSCKVETIS